MIDLATARETFEDSADLTVGIEEEFALVDPESLLLIPRFESLRDAGAADPVLSDSIAGELICSEIEIRSGAGVDVEDARARQADARRRLFALAAAQGDRARGDRHPPAERLPRAAHHRHGPLPPRRGRAEVRRVAQQHVLGPRPRRGPWRRPRRPRLRPAATGPPAPARDQRELALHRRARLRPALRPQPDVHEVVPALRHPRRVRLVGRVGGLRRAARPHRVDRRVHAALVVRPPAPQLRHRRGAHLRRPDHGRRGRRPGGADRRLRAPCRGRGRRGGDPARSAGASDRGEHVARDPLRAGRPPARPPGAA